MPNTTPEHDERIRTMIVASVYPHYVAEVGKTGRRLGQILRNRRPSEVPDAADS